MIFWHGIDQNVPIRLSPASPVWYFLTSGGRLSTSGRVGVTSGMSCAVNNASLARDATQDELSVCGDMKSCLTVSSGKMLCLLLILTAAISISSFNIDVDIPVIRKSDQLGSYFGFSVALHRFNDGDTGLNNSWYVSCLFRAVIWRSLASNFVCFCLQASRWSSESKRLRIDTAQCLEFGSTLQLRCFAVCQLRTDKLRRQR